MTKSLPFYWVDAFTSKPFGGNPCAVVLDADGMSDAQMLTLAQEMGLSETAFIMAPTLSNGEADFAARYFTPKQEIPLAGHPTIASVRALIAAGRIRAGQSIQLQLTAGIITVETSDAPSPTITMSQCQPEFLAQYDPATAAQFLGLSVHDLITDVPVQTVSTGTPQLMVAVKDRAAVQKAVFDGEAYGRFEQEADCTSLHVFCPEGYTADGGSYARHFALIPHAVEDAFTGSATGGMAAYLYHYGLITAPRFRAEQGHAMGRPGVAEVEVVGTPAAIQTVKVGGQASVLVKGLLGEF